MSDASKPPLPIQQYVDKGLSLEEASLAASYPVEISPAMYQMPEMLFIKGYDCLKISELMPEYPYGALLKARATLEWDKKRMRYRDAVLSKVTDNMKADLAESLRFLGDYLGGMQAEYQSKLVKKMANPEREQMPSISKNEMDTVLNVTKFLRDTLQPPVQRSTMGANGVNPNAQSLTSIQINVGPSAIDVTPNKPVEITQDRAEMIRQERLKRAGITTEDK